MNPFSVIYNNPTEAKLDLTDNNSGVLVNFDKGQASTEVKLGNHDNLVFAGAGNDTLTGGSRTDKLFGGAGNDKISGGEGDDILGGRAGTDILTGGTGSDVFASHISFDAKKAVNTTITDWNKEDKINLDILPKDLQALKEAKNAKGESIAKLDDKGKVIGIDWNKVDSETKDGKTTFKLDQTQISFETKASDSLQELKDSLNSKTQFKEINISPNRTGNDKNNILNPHFLNQDNKLDGKGGNDVLRSGGGNDTLIGGTGSDILLAGEGDDVINTGQGNDIIYTGGGKDTIKAQINTTVRDYEMILQNEGLTGASSPPPLIRVKDLKVGEDKISLELTAANKADLQKQGLIDANGQINWSKFPEPLVSVADDFKNQKSETTYTYLIGQTRISIVADKSFTPQEVFTLGNEQGENP